MQKHWSIKKGLVIAILFGIVFLSITDVHAGIIWTVIDDLIPAPRSGEVFDTELKLSTWDAVVGAYLIRLHYDPTVLQIVQVTVPAQSKFSTSTFVNSNSFGSGTTDICAFQTGNGPDQNLTATVATIQWKALGAPSTFATIQTETKAMIDFEWREIEVNVASIAFEINDSNEDCDNLNASGNYVAAAECYLSLSPPDYWRAGVSYDWAGITAQQEGNHEDALGYFLLAIQCFSLTADQENTGGAYYHAGDAAYQLGNYEDANNYFLQSADHYVSVSNYWRAGVSYDWAGITAQQQGNHEDALGYFLLAIQYFSLTADQESIGGAYYHAGQAAYQLGKYDDAKSYYVQAGDYYKEGSNHWWAGDSYEWAGNIAFAQEQYVTAYNHLINAATQFIEVPDYKRAGDAYHKAGDAAEADGDCPRAISFWTLAKEYYDLAGVDYTIPSCPADINADGHVDLMDAILALQVVAGIQPTSPVYKTADVNGDNKIGLEEVIYILQEVAGLR